MRKKYNVDHVTSAGQTNIYKSTILESPGFVIQDLLLHFMCHLKGNKQQKHNLLASTYLQFNSKFLLDLTFNQTPAVMISKLYKLCFN